MVKVTINGIEIIETPLGWDDITSTLRYDRELKALLELFENPLTFFHDGYRLIKEAYDENGYCFSYPIIIYREDELNQYVPIYNGTLFFKDIEFGEGVNTGDFYAKCQFTDNSFFAKVFNNRNLKAKIYVPRSKSDVTITAAEYWRITFFDPATGTYYPHLSGPSDARNDTGFKVYEVLRFLVAYMSDGEVDFESDFFSAGGDGEGAMITCGKIPRFTQSGGMTQELFEEIWPDLSFADVFKELDKVYNLGIRAGYDGARPYIRIESNDYLFPNTDLQNLPNVERLKRKTALEYLYAKVVIGSTTTTNETFLSYFGFLRLVGWNEEEYVIVQDCNTDRELNLVNEWMLDSNTIEDILVNYATVPTTNDNQIILIDTILNNGSFWGDAKQTNWLISPPPPYYYNELYNNENKLKRYLGGIPAPVAAYLNTDADRFLVSTTATYGILGPPLIHEPTPFDDDSTPPNFDSGGNFDPTATNYDYTVPVTSIFSLVFNGKIMILASQRLVIRMECWDATYTTLKSGALLYDDTPPVGLLTFTDVFATFYAEITDKIKLTIAIDTGGAADLYAGATWECTSVGANGGIFADYDPRDYPIIRNTFDYPMSFKEYRELKAQPLGLLSFGVHDAKTYFAWIEEVKFKHFGGKNSTFTLISNETTN